MGIFIKEFINSIKSQTFQNFTILLIDDTSNKNKERIIKELKNFKLVILDGKGKGNINRIIGLKYIQKNKKNFDIVVFGDSDDYMHKDRIKIIEKFFLKKKAKLICSNLIFKKNQTIKSDMFFKNKISPKDLFDFYVIGLGCLSVRISLIKKFIEIIKECKTNILDWFLITIFLIEHKENVIVLKKSKVNYRLYANNLIGNPYLKLTKKKIKFLYESKVAHYQNIIDYLTKKNIRNVSIFNLKKRLDLCQKNLDKIMDKKNRGLIARIKKILTKKNKLYWFQSALSDEVL